MEHSCNNKNQDYIARQILTNTCKHTQADSQSLNIQLEKNNFQNISDFLQSSDQSQIKTTDQFDEYLSDLYRIQGDNNLQGQEIQIQDKACFSCAEQCIKNISQKHSQHSQCLEQNQALFFNNSLDERDQILNDFIKFEQIDQKINIYDEINFFPKNNKNGAEEQQFTFYDITNKLKLQKDFQKSKKLLLLQNSLNNIYQSPHQFNFLKSLQSSNSFLDLNANRHLFNNNNFLQQLKKDFKEQNESVIEEEPQQQQQQQQYQIQNHTNTSNDLNPNQSLNFILQFGKILTKSYQPTNPILKNITINNQNSNNNNNNPINNQNSNHNHNINNNPNNQNNNLFNNHSNTKSYNNTIQNTHKPNNNTNNTLFNTSNNNTDDSKEHLENFSQQQKPQKLAQQQLLQQQTLETSETLETQKINNICSGLQPKKRAIDLIIKETGELKNQKQQDLKKKTFSIMKKSIRKKALHTNQHLNFQRLKSQKILKSNKEIKKKNLACKIETHNNKQSDQKSQMLVTTDDSSENLKIASNCNNNINNKKSYSNQKFLYRQSKHKNVYKNFGTAIIKYIKTNEIFKQKINQTLQNNSDQISKFNDWIVNDIQLIRKKDYKKGWTIQSQDSKEICEFKQLLKDLSLIFFQTFANEYLNESKKLKQATIHKRSILSFIEGIHNPLTLDRFKPSLL